MTEGQLIVGLGLLTFAIVWQFPTLRQAAITLAILFVLTHLLRSLP